MNYYTRPGVYVEEKDNLSFSVAEVETAIPAFIGYTEKGPSNEPTRITSMLEFEKDFGGAAKEQIVLKDDETKGLILEQPEAKFLMYYSLQLFFANGGGPCYIVSVGDYDNGLNKNDLKAGLDELGGVEDPTLIVFPDAVALDDESKFYEIYRDALNQANLLKDRFVIMDTYEGSSITTTGPGGINTINYFRQEIGNDNYGAAYFPHLKTTLTYNFDESSTITHTGLQPNGFSGTFFLYEKAQLDNIKTQVVELENSYALEEAKIKVKALFLEAVEIINHINETADSTIQIDLDDMLSTIAMIDEFSDIDGISAEIQTLIDDVENAEDVVGHANNKTLDELKGTELYAKIKGLIKSLPVVLPASSAIAGVYARVDSTRGVWKSPANTGLNYVISPTEKVSDTEQEALNVDAAGKSINAIRSLSGKGTLVWGARTLDGNSDNWRYISVRRFFIMVEESIKNATKAYIGQPNNERTWLRTKATVENFLNLQWRNGALLGSKPDEAYYVKVGLDEAVADGKGMKIEIGLSVVRPSEFIVLNFTHKL